jgi:hypothetical protein
MIGPGLYGAPASIMPRAALALPIVPGAAFALRPLRGVAASYNRCDHDYPRWGGHKPCLGELQSYPCSSHRLLSWGRSFLSLLGSGPSLCPGPTPL